jgi:hypothetical protein
MFFYDHIILIHHVHSEVEALAIPNSEKQALIDLVEETVHHHILKRILDRLHHDRHREFLDRFHASPHELALLDYLTNHVPDIEDQIKQAADEVKYDLLKTIRKSTSLL